MKTVRTMPFQKYQSYPCVKMPDRTWPNKVIRKAPIWCSVDLRDGNQALSTPMGIDEKTAMFDLLVAMGFKEIEVGFPSASQIEYDFIRKLIVEKRIPDDVTIQVITQAREDLIRRTFGSLDGAARAIVHLYNSTSTVQRKVVFNRSKQEIIKIARDAAIVMQDLKNRSGSQGTRFQYSPESFPGTELTFALDICHAVIDIWKPTAKNKVIINLPETVEMGTPNIYADRIEWFIRHVRQREALIISVHTHNDRGTGVAAAELAMMAGAQRVEGALFGNGERTGNMDIITMAMNLYSNGVDPHIDFSDIDHIRDVYTQCTKMDVHARHPYAGELVYTAFSGSHQDAINKGMRSREKSESVTWDVPYLPIDPKDVGRSYASIIRINSQSGKGGVAYIMEKDWGICIPKEMQRDFSAFVQAGSELKNAELSSMEIYDCFKKAYLEPIRPLVLDTCAVHTQDDTAHSTKVHASIYKNNVKIDVHGAGNGPVDAFVNGINSALGISLDVTMFLEHALTKGSDAKAIAYIGLIHDKTRPKFGVGIDENVSLASIKSVVSALNRILIT